MTIIIAARDRKKNKIHLLSDSLGTDSELKYNSGIKWSEFRNFYVGTSGDISVKVMLRDYMSDTLNQSTIETKRDVIALFRLIEHEAKEQFDYKVTTGTVRDYIDFTIIVATKNGKLFTCDQFLFVEEPENFAVIGSGTYHAQGILTYLFRNNQVSEKNLLETINVVYEYKYNCGGPTHIISFKPEQ